MKEIDCRICKNCTGFSCKIYGSNADKAVKNCAKDNFINYKKNKKQEIEIIDKYKAESGGEVGESE